jgi:hypothetical protein
VTPVAGKLSKFNISGNKNFNEELKEIEENLEDHSI